ncbi:hypothetical protein KEM52_006143 [Ascosphaera acerosa]|nr:hypothetical protein KEM52_006143 [Ascosphaera acerosa]
MRPLSACVAAACAWSLLLQAAWAIFADEAYEFDYHHELLGAPVVAAAQPAAPAARTLLRFGKPAAGAKGSLVYALSEELMLGAINPRDGTLVWRQDVGAEDITGTAAATAADAGQAPGVRLLKQAQQGEVVVAGAENTVSAWVAVSGRLAWSAPVVGGELVDLAVSDGHGVAVLERRNSGYVVQLRDVDNGLMKWRFVGTSAELPLKLVATASGLAVVSLQSAKKIHVCFLNSKSGAITAEHTLATSSDVSPDTILHISDDGPSPLLAWTDANGKQVRVNLLGSDTVHDIAIQNPTTEAVQAIRVHVPVEGGGSEVLVSYETATSSWADILHLNPENTAITKRKSLPLLRQPSLYACNLVNGEVFFTRVTDSEITLFSSTHDAPLGQWAPEVYADKPVHVVAEVVPRGRHWSVRYAAIHQSGDVSMVLNGERKWIRAESLTDVVAAAWTSLPTEEALAHELEIEGSQGVLGAYVHRVQRHLRELAGFLHYLQGLPSKLANGLTLFENAGADLSRFDVGKTVIVATKSGRVAAIDTARHGLVSWNVQVSQDRWVVESIECSHGVATITTAEGKQFLIAVADGSVRAVRDGVKGVEASLAANAPTDEQAPILVTRDDDGRLTGWTAGSTDTPAWAFAPAPGEQIIDIATRAANEPVASIGIVLGDRSVLYKYLNPNLVLVTTTGRSTVSLYLLNGVSGQILHSVRHEHADPSKPIAAVISENWFAYSFFSDASDGVSAGVDAVATPAPQAQSKGYHLVINELYESPLPNDRGVLGAAQNYTNLELPRPHIVSASYVVPEPIAVMAATQTRQGITLRNVLAYLPESSALASIPRVLLNARRPAGRDPTPAEAEEGLVRYHPALELDGRWFLTHAREVRGVRAVVASPTLLESTGLVFAFGALDMFGTRVHPSMAFDVLGKGFNKLQLLLTVVGLTVGVAMLQPVATRKQINQLWSA